VPKDTPVGEILFGWTWFNREQEFNMNCAVVDIVAADGSSTSQAATQKAPKTPATSDTSDTGCTSSDENAKLKRDLEALSAENFALRARAVSESFYNKRSIPESASERPFVHPHGSYPYYAPPNGKFHSRINRRDPAPEPQNAPVRVVGTSGKTAFSKLPGFLVADTGNGCMTPHTTAEVKYPNPGDVVELGDGEYPLEPPSPAESCGA
jgi:hypothetical protein